VFETTGWDTHANQGADQGALSLRLAALDAGLRALRDALGSGWPMRWLPMRWRGRQAA